MFGSKRKRSMHPTHNFCHAEIGIVRLALPDPTDEWSGKNPAGMVRAFCIRISSLLAAK